MRTTFLVEKLTFIHHQITIYPLFWNTIMNTMNITTDFAPVVDDDGHGHPKESMLVSALKGKQYRSLHCIGWTAFSMLSVCCITSIFSLFSVNSFFSIASVNSWFSLWSVNRWVILFPSFPIVHDLNSHSHFVFCFLVHTVPFPLVVQEWYFKSVS